MRIDRRTLLAGSFPALAAATARTTPSSLAAQIDAIGAGAVATGVSPGLAVGIGDAAGPVLVRGAGQANLETATPIATASVFRIGSLSKQFTAAAAIRLAALGKLDLDAPVSSVLPVFAGKPVFSLREAMHHTAGLRSDDSDEAVPGAEAKTQVEFAELVARQPQPFEFAPGTAWHYSNANYVVLGAAIEAVTGQPFDLAMADLLFRPLGLRSTSVDRSRSVVRHRVNGYAPTGAPGSDTWQNAVMDVWPAGGAGSIRSSVTDLLAWHRALLHRTYLSENRLAEMLRPGTLRDGRLSGANRFSPDDASYGAVQYAGGLLVSPPGERRTILHYGFIAGFSALLESDLASGRTLAVLLNADPGPNTPFRSIRKLVFG